MKLYFNCLAIGVADLISYNRLLNNLESGRKNFVETNDQVLLQYVDFFCCQRNRHAIRLFDGVPLQCARYRELVRDFSFSSCN